MNTITMCGIASNVSLVMPIRTIVTNAMPFTKNIKNGIIFITPVVETAYAASFFVKAAFDCKSAMIVSMSIW